MSFFRKLQEIIIQRIKRWEKNKKQMVMRRKEGEVYHEGQQKSWNPTVAVAMIHIPLHFLLTPKHVPDYILECNDTIHDHLG
jgi:hypothetical protein